MFLLGVSLSFMCRNKWYLTPFIPLLIAVCVSFLLTPYALAIDYKYKKVDDFQTLENFETVEAFETSFGGYIQDCLDNTYGGTGGIPCLIADQIWDRQLNNYYNKLLFKLDRKGKDLLKKSQQEWIQSRDLALKFNSHLLDIRFKNEEGTMFLLMRAEDADSASVPMAKQRALLLKSWLESISNDHNFDF